MEAPSVIPSRSQPVKCPKNTCRHCGNSFTSAGRLDRHCACDFCGKIFTNRQMFTEHLLKNHYGPYACKECDKVFKEWKSFRQHTRKVHNKDRYPCDECGLLFKYTFQRSRHMRDHHNVPINYVPRNPDVPFKCPECDKMFIKNFNFKAHFRRRHSQTTQVTCDVCYRPFKTMEYCLKYRSRKHTDNVETPKPLSMKVLHDEHGAKLFPCTICKEVLASKHRLKYHRKKFHYTGPPQYCQLCNKVFATKLAFKGHNKFVHPKERKKCLQCPKSFKVRQELMKHIQRVHSDSSSKKNEAFTQFETVEIKLEPIDYEETPMHSNIEEVPIKIEAET